MLGVQARGHHRRLVVEAQPLLDAEQPGALGQVAEQHQIERQRGGQDRVAAQEVDLQLHRVTEPSEDVDVVPTLLVVATRRVVVDPHLVVHVAVQLREDLGIEDVLEHAELGLLLGLEVVGIVEHLTVAVPEDVGRVPARQPEHAGLQHWPDHRLDQCLTGLEILAADRDLAFVGQVAQRRDVDGQIRCPVGEGHALEDRRVGVEHRRSDRRVVGVDGRFECFEVHVRGAGLDEDLGAGGPQHHDPLHSLLLAEAVDVFADGVEHAALVDRVHRVVGVDALDVFTVERCRHRAHLAQGIADRLDVLAALEHTGAGGGYIGVVGERVPRTEHDVFQRCERQEVLDQRSAVVGAFAEADRAHLGQRANWQADAPLDQFDTGDQRRRHGAETDREYAEPTFYRSNGGGGRSGHG